MAQYTINLPISGDTFVDCDNPGVNYYSDSTLKVGEYSNVTSFSDKRRYGSALAINRSSVPARKKIISAALKIYLNSFTAAGDVAAIEITPRELTTLTAASLGGKLGALAAYLNYQSNYLAATGLKTLNILTPNTQEKAQSFAYGTTQIALSQKEDYNYAGHLWTFSSINGANAPYISLVYEDSPPLQPIASVPNADYLPNSQVIRFEWEYRAEYGGVQKTFSLDWRVSGGAWNTINSTTPNNYYDLAANTVPNGNIEWRVKTTNEYDEVSVYSDILKFYAIGAPATPTVNVNVSPIAKPTVTWAATNQQVWQLQILDATDVVVFDTGNMPGVNVFSHTLPGFFEDGNYTARIRVRNEYDFWSEWGNAYFTISTTKPSTPTLSAVAGSYGVTLTAGFASPSAIIYRKAAGETIFIPIAVITSGSYADNTVASGKVHTYKIRAVNADYSFKDSTEVTATVTFNYPNISSALAPETVKVLKFRLDVGSGRVRTTGKEKTLVNFIGREYPAVEVSGYRSKSISMSYYVPLADIEALETIIESEVLLYRNELGQKIYGTAGSMQEKEVFTGTLKGYEVSFTISQIDYSEEVDV